MLGVGMLVVTIDWSFACFIAPVVATTLGFIIRKSSKIQMLVPDVLLPAYLGCSGKWPINEYCVAVVPDCEQTFMQC